MNEAPENLMGVLGGGPSKYNLRMAATALANDYPITPEIRQLIVEQATMIASTANSKRTRLAAAKVLLAADNTNIKRQLLAVEERKAEVTAATAMVDISQVLEDVRKQREINHRKIIEIDHANGNGKFGRDSDGQADILAES